MIGRAVCMKIFMPASSDARFLFDFGGSPNHAPALACMFVARFENGLYH